jgi:hypothetical protein
LTMALLDDFIATGHPPGGICWDSLQSVGNR